MAEKEVFKKVGNTSFRIDTIKGMNFKQFEETYSEKMKGSDLKKVYEEITGKAVEAGKSVKKGENA